MLIAENTKFIASPVLAAPSLPLATHRITQKGMTPDSNVKSGIMVLMLPHMPYSGLSAAIARASINWKIRPVAMLINLAANMTYPVY